MSKLTPTWPTRADHRFMVKLTALTGMAGKIHPVASEFDRLSRVFVKAGGSWKRVFHGSADDINLLKTVMKVAFKNGYLTKKEAWK